MESKLFQNETPEERIILLRDNAEKTEEMTFHRPLSVEEVEKDKSDFSQNAIEISAIEDELAGIKEEFKARIKPKKELYQKLLSSIKTRSKEVTEDVFIIADYDEKMMGIYNSNGELITSRRMVAEEMQMSINSNRVLKIAKNG